jgi:hypothetical protein
MHVPRLYIYSHIAVSIFVTPKQSQGGFLCILWRLQDEVTRNVRTHLRDILALTNHITLPFWFSPILLSLPSLT